ncbi:hypothetical protein CEXT_221221 [Caerostris extrusa]|uniref:Uncharacterized protein n=1 Tax=Caerostris extrusa TaxID=172846 RepID=A0AAV4UI59_CAEEX|nr:hypothetical protein CEXT_221221 [Caerostris extrusa]
MIWEPDCIIMEGELLSICPVLMRSGGDLWLERKVNRSWKMSPSEIIRCVRKDTLRIRQGQLYDGHIGISIFEYQI